MPDLTQRKGEHELVVDNTRLTLIDVGIQTLVFGGAMALILWQLRGALEASVGVLNFLLLAGLALIGFLVYADGRSLVRCVFDGRRRRVTIRRGFGPFLRQEELSFDDFAQVRVISRDRNPGSTKHGRSHTYDLCLSRNDGEVVVELLEHPKKQATKQAAKEIRSFVGIS